MMSLLVALIRNNIPAALLVLLLVLGGGYGCWLRSEVSELEARLEAAKIKAASLEISNMSLLGALKQQNAAVAELAKRSNEKKKRAAAHRLPAHQRSIALQRAADSIMAFAPAGTTECEQIKELLGVFLRGLYDGDR